MQLSFYSRTEGTLLNSICFNGGSHTHFEVLKFAHFTHSVVVFTIHKNSEPQEQFTYVHTCKAFHDLIRILSRYLPERTA